MSDREYSERAKGRQGWMILVGLLAALALCGAHNLLYGQLYP